MRGNVQVAQELGENMTDEEIYEMIQAGDLDKDGMINEDEFLRHAPRPRRARAGCAARH